jgi:hypothetical protein
MPGGLLGALGLIFIVLKLCAVIAWSWFWVLSPFILWFIIFLLVVFLPAGVIAHAIFSSRR